MNYKRFKCGIIGFGKMGRIRADTILKGNFADIVWVCDKEDVKDFDLENTKLTSNEEDLFNDPNLDVIFICTVNVYIPILAIKALNFGKHVFAEKPPGFTASDVEKIIEAERKSGKYCMFGFNHRHHKSISKMKEIVSSGELGRILWMRGRYGKEVDKHYFKDWRVNSDLAGAGILLDQGIHMLDLIIHLAGEFDIVHSLISNLYWEIPGIEDNAFVLLKQKDSGICASFHSTMTQWRYLFSLEVFLEKGSLILNGLKTSSGVYGDEILNIKYNFDINDLNIMPDEAYTYRVNSSWHAELTHFFNSLNKNSPIKIGNTKDALILMRHIDNIYASDNIKLKNIL